MASYTVKVTFNSYDLPLVQTIDDPKEGVKGTIHEGTRADGSIYIPAGKKSQKIRVTGIIMDSDGYADLTDKINTLKTSITTSPATLTLKYWDDDHSGGGAYVNSWSYTVIRTEEIEIDDETEMRTDYVKYTVEFTVLSY
jgi:hypothetical protein